MCRFNQLIDVHLFHFLGLSWSGHKKCFYIQKREILGFQVAELLYNYFCPSNCRSGYKRKKCKNLEMRFSRPQIKLKVYFFLWTFFSFISIYSINILIVGLSVRLKKCKMWNMQRRFSWPPFEFSAVHIYFL